MEHAGLVRRIGEDASQVADELRRAGYLVFVLPARIVDAKAFFEAIKTIVPLDPPLVGNRSWDALSDSLWGGLDQLASDKIAIIWPTADVGAPDELGMAIDVLEDVSQSLADPEATDGTPKTLAVVIT